MRELDKRIANLRLRLAEISSRQEQLRALHRQFNSQIDKVVDFAIREKGDLDAALSMADEVDVRLHQTERTLHYLEKIRAKGQEELEALLLTRSIEIARTELAELEARRQELEAEMERAPKGSAEVPPSGKESRMSEERARLETQYSQVAAEIKRLHRLISEASDEAARAVSARARKQEARDRE